MTDISIFTKMLKTKNRPVDWMSCAIWAAALVLTFVSWGTVVWALLP